LSRSSTFSAAEAQAIISQLLASAGLATTGAARDQLAAFLQLLLRWSKRINLTGYRDPCRAAEGLLGDALPLVSRLGDANCVLDVGAGAGGMAAALAVLCPHLSLRLLEPRGKRAAFLRALRRELNLPRERFEIMEQRGEVLAQEPPWADVAYAQAVMAPLPWLALGRRLVVPGGRVVCLSAEPLPACEWEDQGVTVAEVVQYRLPTSGLPRTVTFLGLPPFSNAG